MAFGAFAAFSAILGLMLFKASLLARYGLLGPYLFIVLVLLGLCAAAFLFGVLRSYATYKGQVLNGTLELGGPVVLLMLVVVVGMRVKVIETRPLTVIAFGEGGTADRVLRGAGRITLTLGAEQNSKPIGAEGQAVFPDVSSSVLAQPIPVSLDADGFELVSSSATLRVEGGTAWLAIRARPATFTGYVLTKDGAPVPAAAVSAAGVSSTTDGNGYFRLVVPGAGPSTGVTLVVTAAGYQPWHDTIVPRSNEIGVRLTPSP